MDFVQLILVAILVVFKLSGLPIAEWIFIVGSWFFLLTFVIDSDQSTFGLSVAEACLAVVMLIDYKYNIIQRWFVVSHDVVVWVWIFLGLTGWILNFVQMGKRWKAH